MFCKISEASMPKFFGAKKLLSGKTIRFQHRHFKKWTAHWPGHPAFVDSSTYVANRHKTHFGVVCRASVLICPQIQHHGYVQWPTLQIWPRSSLFFLDVCVFQRVGPILRATQIDQFVLENVVQESEKFASGFGCTVRLKRKLFVGERVIYLV